jgi:hypothetical protein
MSSHTDGLEAVLGNAGYGVRDPRNPGEWIADAYDTPEEALEAARATLALQALPAGTRARLKCEVWRYPHFKAAEGLTGTVTACEPEMIALRMDEPLAGAEEWNNEIHWYPMNGDNALLDLEVLPRLSDAWSSPPSAEREPQHGAVRQHPETGDWQEYVGGQWWDWMARPLCSCEVADDGDGESGPHLVIVEPDPACRRCTAEREANDPDALTQADVDEIGAELGPYFAGWGEDWREPRSFERVLWEHAIAALGAPFVGSIVERVEVRHRVAAAVQALYYGTEQ